VFTDNGGVNNREHGTTIAFDEVDNSFTMMQYAMGANASRDHQFFGWERLHQPFYLMLLTTAFDRNDATFVFESSQRRNDTFGALDGMVHRIHSEGNYRINADDGTIEFILDGGRTETFEYRLNNDELFLSHETHFGSITLRRDEWRYNATTSERFYLETDIFAIETSGNWMGYPENDSFEMIGRAYRQGMTAASSGSATYDISGLGFTRITGDLGFARRGNLAGGRRVEMDFVCADTGEVFSRNGFNRDGNNGREFAEISIIIPPHIERMTIRLRVFDFPSNLVGFGNVYFSAIEGDH